jgi:hypothetical protein
VTYSEREVTEICHNDRIALKDVKLLQSSVVSNPTGHFMTAGKKLYLNKPVEHPKYMRIPVKLILQEIINNYKLTLLIQGNYIYIEMNKGMHGLPQAGLLANGLLAHPGTPSPHTCQIQILSNQTNPRPLEAHLAAHSVCPSCSQQFWSPVQEQIIRTTTTTCLEQSL